MKALVYQGPDQRSYEEKPMPLILETPDAIVRITKTTICGTDLHIMNGDVPTVLDGRILGHEGVGIIEQIEGNVSNFQIGERVLISCISSCGRCANCKKGMYSYCENGGGWILGNLIDGTQAEYVRIPFADNSLCAIPDGADEESLVMLSDILPTGFECAVLLTAQFYSPAAILMVDNDDNRLEVAKKFGATLVIHNDLGMEKALDASAVFGNAILERQPLKEQLPGNDSHGG